MNNLKDFLKRDWQVNVITFYGRSGSYFLQSLFDGHPFLMMVPPYTMFDYYRHWEDGPAKNKTMALQKFNDHFHLLENSNNFVAQNSHVSGGKRISEYNNLGENQDQSLRMDRQVFDEVIDEMLGETDTVTSRDLFIAIHIAYHLAIGNDPNDIMDNHQILWQLHTPDAQAISRLWNDFPKMRILYSIREPLQTFGSHMKHYINKNELTPMELHTLIYHFLWSPYIESYVLGDKIHNHCRAVKLEDLHSRPEQILKEASDFIGIPWDDCLMTSTVNKLTFWWTYGNEKVTGFHNHSISKKHSSYFNDFDQLRLNSLLQKRKSAWGYETTDWYEPDLLANLLLKPFSFYKFPTYPSQTDYKDMVNMIVKEFINFLQTRENKNGFKEVIPFGLNS